MITLGTPNGAIVTMMRNAFGMTPPKAVYLHGLKLDPDSQDYRNDQQQVSADIHASIYMLYRAGQVPSGSHIRVQWHTDGTPIVTMSRAA